MTHSDRKDRVLAAECLQALLETVCLDLGFCRGLQAEDLLEGRQELTPTEFANAVLAAEGMTPAHEPGWIRRLANYFKDRFGNSLAVQDQ